MSIRGINGSAKGGAYERALARQLSQWWCGSPLALHRVAGSGGRKSKSFAGGDIVPVSDLARPWPFCIEAKRGYEKTSLENLIAGNPGEPLLAFLCQTVAAARLSEGSIPLMILKKNRKPPLAFLSTPGFSEAVQGYNKRIHLMLHFRLSSRYMPKKLVVQYGVTHLFFDIMPLSAFFATFSRQDFGW